MNSRTAKYIFYGIILFVFIGIIYTSILGEKQDEVFKQDSIQYQQALGLLGNKQYDQGITILNDLLVKYPEEYEIYYNIALAYSAKQDYEKAAITFQKALNIRPALIQDPTFTFKMGESLYNIDQYEIAKTYLTMPAPEKYQAQKDELLKLLEEQIQS